MLGLRPLNRTHQEGTFGFLRDWVTQQKVIPFYGETGVDQPTMTATALTALATATISAANSANVFGFGSSTVAKAYVKRMSHPG